MNVWSMKVFERSRVLSGEPGASPVNVLPPIAPSRSPGWGLPNADFGTMTVMVPSGSYWEAPPAPDMVHEVDETVQLPCLVSPITNTAGTPASVSVPYSNIGGPLAPVV